MSPKKQDISTVSVVHPICCGLDVHKNTVVACVLWADQDGREQYEQKEFGTLTDELLALKEWLFEHECPVVVIESTGVYRQSVHNVLEGSHQVILVNARHIKNVPGRKTDIADSKWLAALLRYGLVKGSFIPPQGAETMEGDDEDTKGLRAGRWRLQENGSRSVSPDQHQDRLSDERPFRGQRKELDEASLRL